MINEVALRAHRLWAQLEQPEINKPDLFVETVDERILDLNKTVEILNGRLTRLRSEALFACGSLNMIAQDLLSSVPSKVRAHAKIAEKSLRNCVNATYDKDEDSVA